MAQFAVRIYRDDSAYRGVVDGWGVAQGRTFREVIRESRKMLMTVLDGAFPDRSGIDPAGAELVVWFEVELRSRRTWWSGSTQDSVEEI